jgi:peroxiredoxin Q/BCP
VRLLRIGTARGVELDRERAPLEGARPALAGRTGEARVYLGRGGVEDGGRHGAPTILRRRHGCDPRWRPLQADAMAIQEGKPAPAFTLRDASGKAVSLADFAGKNVILYFYPKDDTPGCTKEACGFRDAWKLIAKANTVVLGVSADSGESHQKFISKYKLPFPLLSDPDRSVMKTYGAYGEKMMYGKKTVGVIRSTVWIGPDGRVRKHWARVANAAEHPEQVLEAVRSAV